jgi:hypothetical protein
VQALSSAGDFVIPSSKGGSTAINGDCFFGVAPARLRYSEMMRPASRNAQSRTSEDSLVQMNITGDEARSRAIGRC